MDAIWKLALLTMAVAQTVLLIVYVVKPFHHSSSPGFQPAGRSIFDQPDSGLFSKP